MASFICHFIGGTKQVRVDALLGTTDGMPKRDLRWPCEEGSGALDEGLDVRLLHVRPQENLLAGPMLDQREARRVVCVLKHGEATAIWLRGLDRCDETAYLALGRVRLLRKRTIANKYDCSAHKHSKDRCDA